MSSRSGSSLDSTGEGQNTSAPMGERGTAELSRSIGNVVILQAARMYFIHRSRMLSSFPHPELLLHLKLECVDPPLLASSRNEIEQVGERRMLAL